jgi:cytochrome d ubiquinol oxidase subunit II
VDFLPTLWFSVIGVLWVGYLLLEGFDLGVGMHMIFSARSEKERRVMLNTIGPVWDGNEVWLITVGAATFAAFPFWYASLFSTLYVPLTLALLGLIFRAVAIEYRGKGHTERWTRNWTRALGWGSVVVAFCIGAMLALTTTGLPLDKNGDRVGGPFVWLNGYAVLGGLAVVGFCLVHASAFLALKTDGEVRLRARAFAVRWAPVVLPSTIDHAYDLTVGNASSGSYTLAVMSVVAACSLPFILAYQAWSYWVFRQRVSETHIPESTADRVPVGR